jgi:osmotically-inducible protein OsmY
MQPGGSRSCNRLDPIYAIGWLRESAILQVAAKSCVASLVGVKGVSNEVDLKPKMIQANTVKQKIEEALKTDAVREASRISVEVNGNKVILSGRVNTYSEKEDAKYAAWMAPGVTTVENNLQISRYQ